MMRQTVENPPKPGTAAWIAWMTAGYRPCREIVDELNEWRRRRTWQMAAHFKEQHAMDDTQPESKPESRPPQTPPAMTIVASCPISKDLLRHALSLARLAKEYELEGVLLEALETFVEWQDAYPDLVNPIDDSGDVGVVVAG